jgi:hypothetical protein
VRNPSLVLHNGDGREIVFFQQDSVSDENFAHNAKMVRAGPDQLRDTFEQ